MGPGPWGPGPWSKAPGAHGGPAWGMGKATYSQAQLPTVKQSYLLSGKLPTVRHAPNRSIDMHPKGIDMHPKLSIDLRTTTAYMHVYFVT